MSVYITDEDRAIWARWDPALRWNYVRSEVVEGAAMVAVLRVETRFPHWLRATWGMSWEDQLEVLHG